MVKLTPEQTQRLAESGLQAVVVGMIIGGVVLAGFDRVDRSGRERWSASAASRAENIELVKKLRVDLQAGAFCK